MALKAVLPKSEYESLDANTKTFYKLEGDTAALDAEGLDTHPFATSLRNALNGERNSKATITAELNELKRKFEGIDSDAARDALKRVKDLEKELAEGKIPENMRPEIDKLAEARVSAVRDDYEGKLKAITNRAETLASENQKLSQSLDEMTIDNQVRAVAVKMGLHDWATEDAVLHARKVYRRDKDGNLIPYEPDGKTQMFGKDGHSPKPVSEWLESMVKQRPGWAKPSSGGDASGDGKPGTSGRTEGGYMYISAADARDRDKWKAMETKAKAAGKTLIVDRTNEPAFSN